MTEQKDDDFGFSLVDEAELRKYEEELKERLAKQELNAAQLRRQEQELKKAIATEQLTAQQKLEGLKEVFMPLLSSLKKDSQKHYIFWPNRAEKIEAFIKKIDDYIESNK